MSASAFCQSGEAPRREPRLQRLRLDEAPPRGVLARPQQIHDRDALPLRRDVINDAPPRFKAYSRLGSASSAASRPLDVAPRGAAAGVLHLGGGSGRRGFLIRLRRGRRGPARRHAVPRRLDSRPLLNELRTRSLRSRISPMGVPEASWSTGVPCGSACGRPSGRLDGCRFGERRRRCERRGWLYRDGGDRAAVTSGFE